MFHLQPPHKPLVQVDIPLQFPIAHGRTWPSSHDSGDPTLSYGPITMVCLGASRPYTKIRIRINNMMRGIGFLILQPPVSKTIPFRFAICLTTHLPSYSKSSHLYSMDAGEDVAVSLRNIPSMPKSPPSMGVV